MMRQICVALTDTVSQAARIQINPDEVLQRLQQVHGADTPAAPPDPTFDFELTGRTIKDVEAYCTENHLNLAAMTMSRGQKLYYNDRYDPHNQNWVELSRPESTDYKQEFSELVYVDPSNKVVDWTESLANLKRMGKLRNYSKDMMQTALIRLANQFIPEEAIFLKDYTENQIAVYLLKIDTRTDKRQYARKKMFQFSRSPMESLQAALTRFTCLVDKAYPVEADNLELASIREATIKTAIISFSPDEIAVPLLAEIKRRADKLNPLSYEELKFIAIDGDEKNGRVVSMPLQFGRQISQPVAQPAVQLNSIRTGAESLMPGLAQLNLGMNYPQMYFPEDPYGLQQAVGANRRGIIPPAVPPAPNVELQWHPIDQTPEAQEARRNIMYRPPTANDEDEYVARQLPPYEAFIARERTRRIQEEERQDLIRTIAASSAQSTQAQQISQPLPQRSSGDQTSDQRLKFAPHLDPNNPNRQSEPGYVGTSSFRPLAQTGQQTSSASQALASSSTPSTPWWTSSSPAIPLHPPGERVYGTSSGAVAQTSAGTVASSTATPASHPSSSFAPTPPQPSTTAQQASLAPMAAMAATSSAPGLLAQQQTLSPFVHAEPQDPRTEEERRMQGRSLMTSRTPPTSSTPYSRENSSDMESNHSSNESGHWTSDMLYAVQFNELLPEERLLQSNHGLEPDSITVVRHNELLQVENTPHQVIQELRKLPTGAAVRDLYPELAGVAQNTTPRPKSRPASRTSTREPGFSNMRPEEQRAYSELLKRHMLAKEEETRNPLPQPPAGMSTRSRSRNVSGRDKEIISFNSILSYLQKEGKFREDNESSRRSESWRRSHRSPSREERSRHRSGERDYYRRERSYSPRRGRRNDRERGRSGRRRDDWRRDQSRNRDRRRSHYSYGREDRRERSRGRNSSLRSGSEKDRPQAYSKERESGYGSYERRSYSRPRQSSREDKRRGERRYNSQNPQGRSRSGNQETGYRSGSGSRNPDNSRNRPSSSRSRGREDAGRRESSTRGRSGPRSERTARRDTSRSRSSQRQSKAYKMRKGSNCRKDYDPQSQKSCRKCGSNNKHHEFECPIYRGYNSSICSLCEKYHHFPKECQESRKFPPKESEVNSSRFQEN